ncbi:SMP-30/gluconolactonase/LRE family protein [Pseudooceanicola sp. C21-150M6]|uniref:SMP-30/gluconolactonase/LRE family protein n=1 Tax=Pseudooceanicola sp. C21-150M6 TaxID=3434355 RepID=UPI003D7F1969
MKAELFDRRACELGEGPFWHPQRQELFWFDILGGRMLSRGDTTETEHQFNRMVSAAGWVDANTLVIASESDLIQYDLTTKRETILCPIESDQPDMRSNDGRTDPLGGFWIGTMHKETVAERGAIYRYYRGELRRLHTGLTVPNAICFSPAGEWAYFSDTRQRRVFRQPLDMATGWPTGPAEPFLDLRASGDRPERKPDGAVTDRQGNLWIALWGSACVTVFAPDGTERHSLPLPTGHTSCPVFGGADLTTLFVTTARQNLPPEPASWADDAGRVFAFSDAGQGVAPPPVDLTGLP